MRCDKCKWWYQSPPLGGFIGRCMNSRSEHITGKLSDSDGGCGWFMKVRANDKAELHPLAITIDKLSDRIFYLEKQMKQTKPKTPAELLETAKDITRKMGGEVPGTEPPRGCRACWNWEQFEHRDDQGSCLVKNGQTTHFRHTCDEFAGKEIPEPVPTNSADPKWVANEIGELWKAIGELAEKV